MWSMEVVMPSLQLLSTNDTERIVTASIDEVIYEYHIGDGDLRALVNQVRILLKQNAHGKAINLLKSRSLAYNRFPGERKSHVNS
jgi:hypothetical protein